MIKSSWDEAIRLGGYATKLAAELQTTPGDGAAASGTTKMPRCLETICQHLEHVITGNFRGALSSNGQRQHGTKPADAKQSRPDNTRQYPPPIDLFDQLLAELQSVAAVASAKSHSPYTASPTRPASNGGPLASKQC